ncbi:hypothetical protein BJY04DRAFT_199660 [Aspergillus karnatakaensis]|uniref:uncharacterized protein n=1 Tax=Aspergillus karnatakaensis TaxID=1810916 RepID=UPI003CCDEC43
MRQWPRARRSRAAARTGTRGTAATSAARLERWLNFVLEISTGAAAQRVSAAMVSSELDTVLVSRAVGGEMAAWPDGAANPCQLRVNVRGTWGRNVEGFGGIGGIITEDIMKNNLWVIVVIVRGSLSLSSSRTKCLWTPSRIY